MVASVPVVEAHPGGRDRVPHVRKARVPVRSLLRAYVLMVHRSRGVLVLPTRTDRSLRRNPAADREDRDGHVTAYACA